MVNFTCVKRNLSCNQCHILFVSSLRSPASQLWSPVLSHTFGFPINQQMWGKTAGLVKPTVRKTMSAKAGRHSLERNQGFMPTEALSAQRLLGEEGKGGWGREREGSCFRAGIPRESRTKCSFNQTLTSPLGVE